MESKFSSMTNQNFKLRLKGRAFVIIDWTNVYHWFEDLGWEIPPPKLFDYLKSYPEIEEINFYLGIESNKKKSVDFHEEIVSIGFSLKNKEVKWVPAVLETTSHFKILVKNLFETLENVKNANSNISTRLYELSKKVDGLPKVSITNEKTAFQLTNTAQLKEIYDLIEELDGELKKLNINIDGLQIHLREPVKRRKCDFDVEITKDIFNNLDKFETVIFFSGDGDFATLAEDLIINKKKKVIVIFAPGHIGREYDELRLRLREKNLGGLFLCNVRKLQESIGNKYPQRLLSGA